MAWWDHEELKSASDRSDRYKVEFPEEYTNEQVSVAKCRLSEQIEKQRVDRIKRLSKNKS